MLSNVFKCIGMGLFLCVPFLFAIYNDINLANLDELEDLPGIGPVTAEKIVNYRRINGPFLSADDLLAAGLTRSQVAGIEEFILFR